MPLADFILDLSIDASVSILNAIDFGVSGTLSASMQLSLSDLSGNYKLDLKLKLAAAVLVASN